MNVTAPQTLPLDVALQQAIAHHQAGRLKEAAHLYRAILQVQPDQLAANHNLGILAGQAGRLNEAEASYRQVLKFHPGFVEAHCNLGDTLLRLGRLFEAEASYRRALELKPDFAEAHNNLGNTQKCRGLLEDAVASYRRALEVKPDFIEAYSNLGSALRSLGQLDSAEEAYRRALEIKPNYAVAYNNLGITLRELNRSSEAEASYRRALELKPEFAEAYCNLGITLNDQGRFAEAEASYRRALELKPGFAEAYCNLGITLYDQGRFAEAEASYRRALELKPDYPDAHKHMGNALRELNRPSEAEASYRRALELKPDFVGVHGNLGFALIDQGRFSEAETSFRRAIENKPDSAKAHFNLGKFFAEHDRLTEAEASYRQAMELQPHALGYAIHAYLLLPIIPDTVDTIAAWRKRFQSGIATLMSTPGSLEDPADKLSPLSFYLAYHNQDDRPIMEDMCHFFRARVAGLTATVPDLPCWQPPVVSGRRIRVGFLSQFLVDHTIGKHYKGFIHHLDRSRFEVLVIHAPQAKHDAFRQELDALADKALTLPARLKDQQQAVADEKLDVLFYPDIGMASSTYFLAYARLAPVQATSWGHPDTSGLDTMDYYVSSVANEPEDAEAFYTERLIRLNRLPCFYYHAQTTQTQSITKAELGLPETGTLYGCLQSLFKLHPDFDAVLAAIAEGDPTGHIVLPEGKFPAWTGLLKTRWEKRFPRLLNQVLFLPRMPWNRFMEVMGHMDVLLDPLHFGSGNTLYDAMIYGIPVVTWQGRFARGRNVAAAYRQMGVADAPIAPCLEDYAPLALELGHDPERRRALRQASLQAACRELFSDMRAVREFEAFLEAAVVSAGRGEKLPVGWKPDIQASQA